MKIFVTAVAGLKESYHGSSVFVCCLSLGKKLDPFAVPISEKQDHYHKVFHREAYSKNRKHI